MKKNINHKLEAIKEIFNAQTVDYSQETLEFIDTYNSKYYKVISIEPTYDENNIPVKMTFDFINLKTRENITFTLFVLNNSLNAIKLEDIQKVIK